MKKIIVGHKGTKGTNKLLQITLLYKSGPVAQWLALLMKKKKTIIQHPTVGVVSTIIARRLTLAERSSLTRTVVFQCLGEISIKSLFSLLSIKTNAVKRQTTSYAFQTSKLFFLNRSRKSQIKVKNWTYTECICSWPHSYMIAALWLGDEGVLQFPYLWFLPLKTYYVHKQIFNGLQ